MATSSHYDSLAPLEPGEDPYKPPFQRRTSANDTSPHHVSPLTKCANNDELVASVEVVHRRERNYDLLQHRKKVAISVADPVTHYSQSSIEASSEFTFWSTSSADIFQYNQHQPPAKPPPQSPSSQRMGLFSFTKRHFRLPFSLGRSKRDSPATSDKQQPCKSLPAGLRQKQRSSQSSLTSSGRFTTSEKFEGGKKSNNALAHNFRQISGSRFSMHQCEVCHKGFTGFMKQGFRCTDCYIMVHRHCEDRVPPCKAQIESGSYVTMSRNKVVKKLRDLDSLSQFLLEKIATLSRGEQPGSLVDRVFRVSLSEFHTALLSSYSLKLQNSMECSTDSYREKAGWPEKPRVHITFSQLVDNFSSIFRGIAHHEGLNDPCYIAVGINHIKTLLDEFSKARLVERNSASERDASALRRKLSFQKMLQRTVSKGQRFWPWQFRTNPVMCDYCSRAISQLENGDICEACDNACHDAADCHKKTPKKNDGRRSSKLLIPDYNPKPPASKLFGVPLINLVSPGVVKVPSFLEQCFEYLEDKGLYTEGVYRRSAGISSKKAVRASLEEDPENACLDKFSVDAVAAAVSGFFRELPEPLLTRELCDEFIRATELTNRKEKLETLHRLIYQLPELNYAILERLLFHLARFAQHQDINKMGPNNLAIIFAPCLFQPQEILKDLQKQIKCLEVIISEQVEKLTASLRNIRSLTCHAHSKALKLTQLSKVDNCRDKASFVNSLKENERKRLASELEEIEKERVELTVNLRKLEPFILLEDDLEQQQDSRRRPTVHVPTSKTSVSRYIVDGPDADQSSSHLDSCRDDETLTESFMESTV